MFEPGFFQRHAVREHLMVRVMLDEKPPESEEENPTESRVLNSEFFSGPRLARRKEVLRGMRGNLHGGHR